jgi:hypothetical protein
MATIKTYPFPNSSILRLNSEKDQINVAPEYQRQGGVWNLEKKQLLIDSILNDYDIPKLYFHNLTEQQKIASNLCYDYSIIDGRQRIETIWEYIDGQFPLSEDFEYLVDPKVKAAGLTYTDLAKEYPKIKIRFDSYTLPVILVETDDIDLIEDMFSRLNEAVPLNSAEKRNSFGGPMAKTIRDLAAHDLFLNKVRFGNNRYQHREMAARLLWIEESLLTTNKIIDTKKWYLDKMVFDYRDQMKDPQKVYDSCVDTLDEMNMVFTKSDTLLTAQATMPIYFLIFKKAKEKGLLNNISRGKLLQFIEKLKENRTVAENDITKANFDYLEFDRLTQQGTSDASSIKERERILEEFLGI